MSRKNLPIWDPNLPTKNCRSPYLSPRKYNMYDIFGENMAYPADNFSIPRKSKGCNFYNNVGLSLIELCCTYCIHILNGRLFKDQHGEFTCFANNGRSVVDYVIASTKFFPLFTDFGVSNYLLSIHCPVYCTLTLKMKQMQQITSEENSLTFWNKIKWNESLKDHFLIKFRELFVAFQENFESCSGYNSASDTLSDFCIHVNPPGSSGSLPEMRPDSRSPGS